MPCPPVHDVHLDLPPGVDVDRRLEPVSAQVVDVGAEVAWAVLQVHVEVHRRPAIIVTRVGDIRHAGWPCLVEREWGQEEGERDRATFERFRVCAEAEADGGGHVRLRTRRTSSVGVANLVTDPGTRAPFGFPEGGPGGRGGHSALPCSGIREPYGEVEHEGR